MSFQDWLLLNDWCLCIPGLILCAVSVGPELCLQPSHLRNYGFDRLKVLWEYSMEGQRWEIVFTLIYFNEKLNEMLPSCRVLFLSFCQGSLCKWGFVLGQGPSPTGFLQLQICFSWGSSYFSHLLTHLCVSYLYLYTDPYYQWYVLWKHKHLTFFFF